MGVKGINHITYAVTNIAESIDFYTNILGLKLVKHYQTGAYLTAGNQWICLSVDPETKPSSDYSHIAFDVIDDDFEDLQDKIIKSGVKTWKDNKSEGKSHYFFDPDGHKLEIHVGSLKTRLKAMK
jgi:catechol 2,3-dioxygenase-like lactoylglutathione lyase family enzyme